VQPRACGLSVTYNSKADDRYYYLYSTACETYLCICVLRRSLQSRGLKFGPAAVCLLGLRVWIPPREWMPLSCEHCVLSSRGLCVMLITRTEESYWVWCVWVWSCLLCNEKGLSH
jgi:hypothetical protein